MNKRGNNVLWCNSIEMACILWENAQGHYKSMHILNNFFRDNIINILLTM